MNMNDYRQALDKINPRDELKTEIISQCAEKPRITHSFSKRKLAPILAAAVIGCTGLTVAATAGGTDWIKGFFSKEDIVITEDIAGFTTEISNFTYESNDIKLSPVGMIADEKTLYAMFHVDSMPEDMIIDNLCLKKAYSENYPDFSLDNIPDIGDNVYQAGSKIIEKENNIVVMLNSTEKCFKNGDTLTAELGYASESGFDVDADSQAVSKISFNITLGGIPKLDVNYDENFIAPIADVQCALESMTINPLIVQTKGLAVGNIEISGNPFQNSNLTINMKDGKAVNATISGYGGAKSLHTDWFIDEPINPENIASVYIGELCLYTAQ